MHTFQCREINNPCLTKLVRADFFLCVYAGDVCAAEVSADQKPENEHILNETQVKPWLKLISLSVKHVCIFYLNGATMCFVCD